MSTNFHNQPGPQNKVTALAVHNPGTEPIMRYDLTQMEKIAIVLFEAQVGAKFPRTVPQILAAMLFAEAYGISPIEAATSVNIIEGKPTLTSGAIASRIKKSGRYNYRQQVLTDDACTFEFFEKIDGKFDSLGTVTFTYAEAVTAGLTTKYSWKNYRQDMLFARALVRGARRFCAALFSGAVYIAEEIEDSQPARTTVTATVTSLNERLTQAAKRAVSEAHDEVVDAAFVESKQAEAAASKQEHAPHEPAVAPHVAAATPKQDDAPHEPAIAPHVAAIRAFMVEHSLKMADVSPIIRQHVSSSARRLQDLTPDEAAQLLELL